MVSRIRIVLPIGLIAGLIGFAHYFDMTTKIILALLIATVQFTNFCQVITVLLAFGLVQLLEAEVLTPKLLGGGWYKPYNCNFCFARKWVIIRDCWSTPCIAH